MTLNRAIAALVGAIAALMGVAGPVCGLSIGRASAAPVIDARGLNLSTVGGSTWDVGGSVIGAMGDATSIASIELAGGHFGDILNALNGGGSITFKAAPESIRVDLEYDNDQKPLDSHSPLLATFDLIPPSGGGNLDFFGGADPAGAIDVTVIENILGSPFSSLLTDSGTPFSFLTTLHLGDLGALIDPDPNDPAALPTQNNGQYDLSGVREADPPTAKPYTPGLPGSWLPVGLNLLMGAGFLAAAVAMLRR